jgi:hypothetical protein
MSSSQVNANDDAELVHSVSWGEDEAFVDQTDMDRINTEFQKAGARGLTILFASGDGGVWSRQQESDAFMPSFPATSPYLTVVGGTDFAQKSTIGDEVAWPCGGGGFSNLAPRPDYQVYGAPRMGCRDPKILALALCARICGPPRPGYGCLTQALACCTPTGKTRVPMLSPSLVAPPPPNWQDQAVEDYLQAAGDSLPPSSFFDVKGRAYPDLSALAGTVNPYCIAIDKQFGGVAGTSAATPVVAGMVAQLNNLLLAAGKPPLGFLNPFIYQVTSEENDRLVSLRRWPAGRGWTSCSTRLFWLSRLTGIAPVPFALLLDRSLVTCCLAEPRRLQRRDSGQERLPRVQPA